LVFSERVDYILTVSTTQSRDTMSNCTTEQRYLLKLLMYRKVGYASILYYCN